MLENLSTYPEQCFHMKNINTGKLYSFSGFQIEINLENPCKKFELLSSKSDSGRKRSVTNDCNGVAQVNTDYLTEKVMQPQILSY